MSAVLVGVSACGGGGDAQASDPGKLDDAGRFACEDFANGYRSAVTRDARVALAGKVAKWAPKSRTDRIADMSEALGRAADGSPGAWKVAADGFAQACIDAGWKTR